MKFISKSANLQVVLKHGIPAEPITGRQPVAGLYAKFENGVINTSNQEMIDLLLKHPGFNRDYILVEEGQIDPYLAQRKPNEPEHDMVQLKYGHIEKNLNPRPALKLNSAQQQLVKELALKIAQDAAPKMAKKMLKDMLEKKVEEKKEGVEEKKEKNIKEQDKSLVCVCGFSAKTIAGLKAHQRFCKKFKTTSKNS